MDLVNTIITLGIIILLVASLAIVFIFQGYLDARYGLRDRVKGKPRKKSTTFLDEGEDEKKCDICYGRINNDPIAICTCGKTFHDACARPTDSCPYCGARYEKMEIREPVMARCPDCGRPLKGGICSCGAAMPRKDNTFTCRCGNVVDADKPVCRRCGAIYEATTKTTTIFKEQK
jgi:hypothetical protein